MLRACGLELTFLQYIALGPGHRHDATSWNDASSVVFHYFGPTTTHHSAQDRPYWRTDRVSALRACRGSPLQCANSANRRIRKYKQISCATTYKPASCSSARPLAPRRRRSTHTGRTHWNGGGVWYGGDALKKTRFEKAGYKKNGTLGLID